MKKHSRPRGFALITALLVTTICMILLGGLMIRSHQGALFTRETSDDVAALYAAEAGVARALAELSDNKAWSPALLQQTLPDGQGSYTLRFDSSHSVNNFSGTANIDGPLGPATVPTDMAYLVVEGQHGGRTKQVEVLVGRGSFFENPVALASGGVLSLQDSVDISGTVSLSQRIPTDVEVYSTQKNANNAPTIGYAGNGNVKIQGNLSTNSNSASINNFFNTAGVVSGKVQGGQGKELPTFVDIQNRVQAASSKSPLTPVFSGPMTALQPQGAKKDYYLNGNLNYSGTLDLQGVNLYVKGDVKVNGGVRGTGSIFVTGSTTIRGDSQLQCSDDNGLALFSDGDITLDGFDGTKYLTQKLTSAGKDVQSSTDNANLVNLWNTAVNPLKASHTRDITYLEHLNNAKQLMGEIQNELALQASSATHRDEARSVRYPGMVGQAAAPVTLKSFGAELFNSNPVFYSGVDVNLAVLSASINSNGSDPFSPNNWGQHLQPIDLAGTQGYAFANVDKSLPGPTQMKYLPGHVAPLLKMRTQLDPLGSPEEQFLYRKLTELNGVSATGQPLGPFSLRVGGFTEMTAGVKDVMDNGSTAALVDLLNDGYRSTGQWPDKPTADRFLLNGSSLVINRSANLLEQLNLDKLGRSYFQGVLYTNGNFSASNDLKILGSLIGKGNVSLANGVSVTFVPELSRRAGHTLGTVMVRQWLRR